MNKLLIVEDDTLLSDMMKRLLLQNYYEIKVAYSGSEAHLILEKESFDLVLLDLMLPGLSDETVLERIREKADTPIIGVSAKTDIDSKVNLLKTELTITSQSRLITKNCLCELKLYYGVIINLQVIQVFYVSKT